MALAGTPSIDLQTPLHSCTCTSGYCSDLYMQPSSGSECISYPSSTGLLAMLLCQDMILVCVADAGFVTVLVPVGLDYSM